MRRKTKKHFIAFSYACVLFAGIISLNRSLTTNISTQNQPLPTINEDNAVTTIPPEYLRYDGSCVCGFAKGITVDKIRQEGYTTLQIPDHITKIDSNAFFNMFDGLSTYVNTLILSKKLVTIGDNAFRGCAGFTNTVDFSSTQIKEIGTSAFEKCSGIKKINFVHKDPKTDTLNSIGECCFADCEGLEEIVLPNSLQNIQNYAFNNCNRAGVIDLTRFKTVPQWMLNNDSIFRNCGTKAKTEEKCIYVDLMNVSQSEWDQLLKKQREDSSPFVVKPSLETVTQAESFSVESREWTWNDQTQAIDTYFLPENYDWSNITTILVPKDAKAISIDFSSSAMVKHPINISFEEGSQLQALEIKNGGGVMIYGDLKLPDSLQFINSSSFEKSNIRKLTLPNNSSWWISKDAFKNSTIMELVIPSLGFTDKNYIGAGAFSGCKFLSFVDLQLPANKSAIEWKLDGSSKIFTEMNSTGTIILPKEVETTVEEDKERLQGIRNQLVNFGFDGNALYDIHTLEPKPENKWFVNTYDGNPFPVDDYKINRKYEVYKTGDNFVSHKQACSVLQLPDNAKIVKPDIFKGLFADQSRQTWVFRPNFGLTTIQSCAFADNTYGSEQCNNGLLVESVLPSTITKMDNPFGTNYNLRGGFAIPDSTTELDNFSIKNTNITDLIIPSSLKTIKYDRPKSSPFKTQSLRSIDLTFLTSDDDLVRIYERRLGWNWDTSIFDLYDWGPGAASHYIYVTPHPDNNVSIPQWKRYVEVFIDQMRSKLGLPTISSIGWLVTTKTGD